MQECKPGCRYVGMEKHPAECEPRGTVGDLYERGGYVPQGVAEASERAKACTPACCYYGTGWHPPGACEPSRTGRGPKVGEWISAEQFERNKYGQFEPQPSSPAAMLGEALELLARADALLRRCDGAHSARALTFVAQASGRVESAKREAEAREGRSDDVRKALCSPGELADLIRAGQESVREQRAICPSVTTGALSHGLGDMPEACLTCAAKRAEERL